MKKIFQSLSIHQRNQLTNFILIRFHSSAESVYQQMPVLPFHRYIGPGNKIDSGDPVDEDDRIAKLHDIEYENARTQADIRKADVKAILQFRKNWKEGNWHSVLGDVGLSLKYFVETYTGVLYPPKLPLELKCRQIYINNIIKLHCVFKERLYDKYTCYVWDANFSDISYELIDHIEGNSFRDVLPRYIYVPIEWLDIFLKCKSCKCEKARFDPPSIKRHDFVNDIFNLHVWIKLIKKFYLNKKYIRPEIAEIIDDSNVFNLGFLN